LEFYNGSLVESTGLYGHSGLRKVDPSDGRVINETPIDESFFGEGLTVVGESVIMLTWHSEVALVFDYGDLSETGSLSFEGEGWGLCFDGEYLVMSNGTSELAFRDPDSFEVSHRISVSWDGMPVSQLNELECVAGLIYANVWLQDVILAINSSSGDVAYFASASFLSENQGDTTNEVLNGIAYDGSREGFWITGKNWTEMYLVSFDPQVASTDSENIGIIEYKDALSEDWPVFAFLLIVLLVALLHRKMPNFKDPPLGEGNGD
jgi:glutamine cyclotransferase